MPWHWEWQGNGFFKQPVWSPFHRAIRNHPKAAWIHWWQGLLPISRPGQHLLGHLSLSRSASRFPAKPHGCVSCYLCHAFPLHHHGPSGLVSVHERVHRPPYPMMWDGMMRVGAPFPASTTSHHTGRNPPGCVLPHVPTVGAREKGETNSSLTSVHLLGVLPACQITAPW